MRDTPLTMLDEIPGWEPVKLPELLAFQRHSITSELAAESMAPKAGTLRAKVLEEIKRGPKTDEQLIDALGMNPSTLRPRRVELVNLGLIETAGTAVTKSGRKALLWQCTERGRQ